MPAQNQFITMQTIDPTHYPEELNNKTDQLNALLKPFAAPDVEVFDSPPLNFRMRAEFRIWHEQGRAHYAMNRPGEKRPYIIDNFPIGAQLINDLMPKILDEVNENPILSRRMFSMEYLTTLSGEALVTLIYHRPLDDHWLAAANALQTKLGILIIGRSRKQKLVLDRDYVEEQLSINGKGYRYQQVENSFTQPNARVNEKMLAWAEKHSDNIGGDLLELYCGNGNFTAVLAGKFNKVLATEISKVSVRSAEKNFADNHIENVTVVRMSSEEFTEALNGARPFRRLRDIDLESYQFSTVFVDPPRAGLDAGTLDLVSRFDNIIYISCNPNTLAENLDSLTKTHQINASALFDQFPWTEHMECGVVLEKKN